MAFATNDGLKMGVSQRQQQKSQPTTPHRGRHKTIHKYSIGIYSNFTAQTKDHQVQGSGIRYI